MNKDQFKGRIKQAKGRIKEVSGKLTRDKLMEKKGQAQKIGGRILAGYGDFKEDTRGYDDLEDDIRGYGDFRHDPQKSG
ncbi:MAG: CsbD family protein [Sulfuricaulis sp.]|uniref:CsbD family protein n=1 Tax=Sulfuricaulis sp. TaxID=2003553 RepID=UPI0025CDCE90|nr:CsbD family protein [Sulfuricaulis sp.]MCR4347652.1 CsbD family protein [Sulfuricaulis sp.]